VTLRHPRLPAPKTATRIALFAVAAALSTGLGACGGDPFAINWAASPDTVLLYSLARPELNLSSGYNFFGRRAVRVESATATGSWDLALDTRGGDLVFLPPGALGVGSRARVTALPGMRFDDVIDAPADTAVYSAVSPLPIEMGTVYVVRTGQSVGAFGRRCSYYAKLEPLVIDVDGGTLTFVFDVSPVCNSLRLIPPD
jgi:hypothetical protein